MGVSLGIYGYSGKDNPEFRKHFEVVSVCLKYGVDVPAESKEFFNWDEFEFDEMESEDVLEKIANGIPIEIKTHPIDKWGNGDIIKISELPKGVDEIHIKMEH